MRIVFGNRTSGTKFAVGLQTLGRQAQEARNPCLQSRREAIHSIATRRQRALSIIGLK